MQRADWKPDEECRLRIGARLPWHEIVRGDRLPGEARTLTRRSRLPIVRFGGGRCQVVSLRSIGRTGLAAGILALVGGIIGVGVAAIVAGDWWLARQPWIGVGLTLLVVGLAMTAVFALLLDAVEPVGWLRLLAVPPALVVGSFWAFMLVVGLPTTGPGGPEHDVGTMLYSLPEMLLILLVATLLISLPLVVARTRRSRAIDGHT